MPQKIKQFFKLSRNLYHLPLTVIIGQSEPRSSSADATAALQFGAAVEQADGCCPRTAFTQSATIPAVSCFGSSFAFFAVARRVRRERSGTRTRAGLLLLPVTGRGRGRSWHAAAVTQRAVRKMLTPRLRLAGARRNGRRIYCRRR